MDLPHYVQHENFPTIIVFLGIFILICWIYFLHFQHFLNAQANREKQRVIEKVIYCGLCNFSVGLFEEKIAVQQVDGEHHRNVVHKLGQL